MKFVENTYTDDDDNDSVVLVHTVDDDSAGSKVNTTSGPVSLSVGQVVVNHGNPNTFDVFTGDQWSDSGYVESGE